MDDGPLAKQVGHREAEVPNGQPAPRSWLRWVALSGVVVCFTLFASCVGCAVVGRRASAEGAEFTATAIASLATKWNAEALLERAAPELLQSAPPDKLRAFIGFVAGRLGPLKNCEGVQNGPWRVFVGTAGPAVFTWHYSDCQFERGPGRVTVQLVRRAGTWKIVAINLNSDLLITTGAAARPHQGVAADARRSSIYDRRTSKSGPRNADPRSRGSMADHSFHVQVIDWSPSVSPHLLQLLENASVRDDLREALPRSDAQ